MSLDTIKDTPTLLHGAAVYPYCAKLADRFTLEDRFEEEFCLFRKDGEDIWLPRRFAATAPEVDLRTDGLPADFANHFEPRNSDQARVVNEMCTLLAAKRSHIVQAPTGYGKTYIGCAAAAFVNRHTLVLTTKEDLMGQWREAARNVLGLTDDQIGEWRGDTVPHESQPFVVALVHSVLKGPTRYPEEVFKRFGFVIPDEVHRMGADQFSQAMWWLPARLRMGLSATPYRKDGRDVVFRSHIGDIEVVGEQETLIPKVIMEHTGWKCPRRIVRHPTTKKESLQRVPHKAGRTMHIFKHMAQDVVRNVKMTKFVRLAYEKDRDIIVFSDTMAHLQVMYDYIVKSGVPKHDIGWYVGLDAKVYSGSKKDREGQREAAKVRRVKLATYKMCSEGTDIPWMDTCVLGAPRSDVNQIVGRIRREYEGKKVPLVYDPVDSDSPVFASYAAQRIKWYRSLGATLKMYR